MRRGSRRWSTTCSQRHQVHARGRQHRTWRRSVDSDQAVISVRDDGIGIEAELLPRRLRSVRAGQARARSQPGRPRRRAHAGAAPGRAASAATSRRRARGLGKGAEFRVYLPCLPRPAAAARSGEPPARPADARSPRRMLVVDDNVDVAETTAAMLTLVGHAVRSATRRHAGAGTGARSSCPRSCCSTSACREIDGYEVARRLRRVAADPARLAGRPHRLRHAGRSAARPRGRLRPPPAQAGRPDGVVRTDRRVAAAKCPSLAVERCFARSGYRASSPRRPRSTRSSAPEHVTQARGQGVRAPAAAVGLLTR